MLLLKFLKYAVWDFADKKYFSNYIKNLKYNNHSIFFCKNVLRFEVLIKGLKIHLLKKREM